MGLEGRLAVDVPLIADDGHGGAAVEVGCVESTTGGELRVLWVHDLPSRSHRTRLYELRTGTEEAAKFKLEECEWRKMDSKERPAERRMWMRGRRHARCVVTITSASAHVELRSEVAGARRCGRCAGVG